MGGIPPANPRKMGAKVVKLTDLLVEDVWTIILYDCSGRTRAKCVAKNCSELLYIATVTVPPLRSNKVETLIC
jgi:hypothetical protein